MEGIFAYFSFSLCPFENTVVNELAIVRFDDVVWDYAPSKFPQKALRQSVCGVVSRYLPKPERPKNMLLQWQ